MSTGNNAAIESLYAQLKETHGLDFAQAFIIEHIAAIDNAIIALSNRQATLSLNLEKVYETLNNWLPLSYYESSSDW